MRSLQEQGIQTVMLTGDHASAADKVAKELAAHLGHEVAIVDINDLGANILGYSSMELQKQPLEQILGDNPLGQGGECTPMGIIRKA